MTKLIWLLDFAALLACGIIFLAIKRQRLLEGGEHMLPNWGWGEWLVVLVIVLIIFGVGRLPEIGGAVGKAISEFRSASKSPDSEEADESQ